MNDSSLARTIQWIVIVFLVFFGPLGWVLIYLLWKQWNPAAPIKKSAAATGKPKVKKTATKAALKKAPAKKKKGV